MHLRLFIVKGFLPMLKKNRNNVNLCENDDIYYLSINFCEF